MRLLMYDAGVIGCWYAVLFSKAGYDTTIYARGKRLDLFQKEGLRYDKKGKIHKADAYYIAKNPQMAWKETEVMKKQQNK